MTVGSSATPVWTVHWLCLGNICRSPLVAFLAGQRLAGQAAASTSAGVAPWCAGRPVHQQMRAAAAAAGIDLPDTLSRRWDPGRTAAGDLVVPLDNHVAHAMAEFGPVPGISVVSLADLGLPFAEMADPYGREPQAFATAVRVGQAIADAFAARSESLSRANHPGR
jgi:protein-tyrosine phosphatase